jgi:hypothetical protein
MSLAVLPPTFSSPSWLWFSSRSPFPLLEEVSFDLELLHHLVPSLILDIGKARITTGCQCTPCLEQRNRIRKLERGSIFNPQLGLK